MHKNNFDFLRLCFALFVIITHSYVLTGAENDGLAAITHGQVNFSGLGVQGFFVISGYLIFESLVRSKNWFDYMVKRILRIFPALIVVLIVSFFIGMIFTDEPVNAYLRDKTAWSYIYNNVSIFRPIQYKIDNVFAHNPLPYSINGSLWTIPYEFLFYIILSIAFIFRRWRTLMLAGFCALFCILLYEKKKYAAQPEIWLPPTGYELKSLIHFGLYFASGSLLACAKISAFKFKKPLLIAVLAGSIVAIILQKFAMAQYVLLPVAIISFGSLSTRGIAGLNKKIGDFSYGVYLFAFPIQQTLVHLFHPTAFQLILSSMAIAIICGALSWHLVEKKALELKRYFP